ncbi:MAG: hypothetical protein HYU63_03460, partial [Armatimonadetes bacterium]|nr:hypothetical protein [Armatimonadota bacterium]
MSNPISGAFNNNNINSLAYIEARELAGAPSETKDQTSEKVNKLKKLFAKKEAEKLKEAETAINQYDFQEIKKTLQKIENPQASLFLLELVSTFEKIPPALNIAEFLPADSNPENETLKNLKKKLSQIPPVYLELLKKRNWKILAIKNEEDLIKSPVLE